MKVVLAVVEMHGFNLQNLKSVLCRIHVEGQLCFVQRIILFSQWN